MSFRPSTPLEQAVYSGNYDATISILRDLSAPERTTHRNRVLHMLNVIASVRWSSATEQLNKWGGTPTDAQARAAEAAIFLCGTAADVAKQHFNVEDMIALGLEFKPSALLGLADALLEQSLFSIWAVQRLISAGLVSRPTSDRYATALIALPNRLRKGETFDLYLGADPGLASVLLSIMDVEGTPEVNLTSVDKYSHGHTWSQILRSMCVKDIYPREMLIDKTLSSLERDWIQFRSGWFSRFHGQLEPTLEEMRPHTARYLALCHSRIPPTVTFALGVVKALDRDSPIEATLLLDAMRPVLASGVKAQVLAALALLDRAIQRAPSVAKQAAAMASVGLAHEAVDVQQQVLARLAKWGIGDELRASLLELTNGIAGANRKAFDALVGVSPSFREAPIAARLPRPAEQKSPLSPDRRILPIDDINELVERTAYVFENDCDVDEFERVVAALVRSSPMPLAEKQRFEPISKRAMKVTKPVAFELARLVIFILTGTKLRSAPSSSPRDGTTGLAQQYLIDRVDAAINLAAQSPGLTPLSTPTHQRGFIDPVELVARVQAHQLADAQSPILEQVQAILRLPAERNEAALVLARSLPQTPLANALRYAIGDDIDPTGDAELLAAAARIRHPNADDQILYKLTADQSPDGACCARYTWRISVTESGDFRWRWIQISGGYAPDGLSPNLLAIARHPKKSAEELPWYSRRRFGGHDPSVIRYTATMLPSSLEHFFSEGCDAIGNNLDWSEARWETSEYLRPLLDASVPLTPMANLLLALALGAKEPGQNAIAVDALVQSWRESRIKVEEFAAVASELFREEKVMASRYSKSLRAALRTEPGIAGSVFDLICIMLEARPSEPPRDTTKLLELLQEVIFGANRGLSEHASLVVSRLNVVGKGLAIKRSLIGSTS